MAHVLFMDIVSYSLLPMDVQQKVIADLQQSVRNCAEVSCSHAHGNLISLPTGDGMALVFFDCPEAPARCALELAKQLKKHPEIKLRMGIHCGPVYRVEDINAARNVAGGGINMAQRVMDCGDAGHILISAAAADIIGQLSTWQDVKLRDLGDAVVKHGVQVHVYNLYTDEVGNPALPHKLQEAAKQSKAKVRRLGRGAALLIVVAAVAGTVYYRLRPAPALTAKDTIVVANFVNKTGEPVFNETLNTALGFALGQSPFLAVLGEHNVAETLQLMARPANTPLTSDVASELCVRSGSKAYIAGAIATLGSEYVLNLKAVNCQNGDILAQGEATAEKKEKVLDALGVAASQLRGQLGESMSTLQKFDVPLAQATTSSLAALEAYGLAMKILHTQGESAALPQL